MSKARELAELSRTVSDSADATAITINSSEEVTFADDIFLADGKKAVFGAGSDATLHSDGSAGYARGFVLQNTAGNKDVLSFVDGGAEVSRSYHRHTVYPLDDWSNESADVKSICDAMHTDSAKEAYRAYLETDPLS